MHKRGRPAKSGLQEGWVLLRAAEVSIEYNALRAAGWKHSSAVTETVEYVRRTHPGMTISERLVRTILAEFQPQNSPAALSFTILQGKELSAYRKLAKALDLPEKFWDPIFINLGIGPRSNYPRANARPNS